MKEERKYYLDNIRWACILLLVPFHCAMAWNSWGEGNYIYYWSNKWFSTFIILISPWYMPLLFTLAGVSARYSLNRRTYRQFTLERVKKLLIPLLTGMVTVVAFMAFIADKFNYGYSGNFFEHYGVFFTKVTDMTGYDGGWTPGHLWFMLYLFIVSMICLVIIVLQRKYLSKISFANMNIGCISLCVILPGIISPILNFGGKSIGTYFILFLLGYYVIFEEKVMDKIHKYRYIFFAVMVVFDIIDSYMYIWIDDANGVLNTIAMYITLWSGILAILGFARKRFNQHNYVTKYLSGNSFSFYIFHFLWIVILQYYLVKNTSDEMIMYNVSVLGTYILTFATIELVKRIPVINKLFGVKKW